MMTNIELQRGSPGEFTKSVLRALDLEDAVLIADSFPGSAPNSSVGEFRNWHITSIAQSNTEYGPIEQLKFYNRNKHSKIKSVVFTNVNTKGLDALCVLIHYETKAHEKYVYQIQQFADGRMAFGVAGQQINPPVFPEEIALLNDDILRQEVPISGLLQSFMTCLTV